MAWLVGGVILCLSGYTPNAKRSDDYGEGAVVTIINPAIDIPKITIEANGDYTNTTATFTYGDGKSAVGTLTKYGGNFTSSGIRVGKFLVDIPGRIVHTLEREHINVEFTAHSSVKAAFEEVEEAVANGSVSYDEFSDIWDAIKAVA